jgi:hypothetical protein
LLPLFLYIGLGSEIRDEQILKSGSGIKHPGSATLIPDIKEGRKSGQPDIQLSPIFHV